MMYDYKFPMCSATATIVVFDPFDNAVAIAVRGDVEQFPFTDSLFGGFMNAKYKDEHLGETIEQAAIRELLEESNTVFDQSQLNLFAVYSNPNTDPRAHVVNVCYWIEATDDQVMSMTAGDDIGEIWWMNNQRIFVKELMAFNHADILRQGYENYLKHR